MFLFHIHRIYIQKAHTKTFSKINTTDMKNLGDRYKKNILHIDAIHTKSECFDTFFSSLVSIRHICVSLGLRYIILLTFIKV